MLEMGILGAISILLKRTCLYMFIIMGPAMIFAFILHFLHRSVERSANTVLGPSLYLWTFGWLGTIVHELGHASMCVLFGHKIIDMQLFNLDPDTGSLGYVYHTYDLDSLWQNAGNFFIAIGPLIFGSIVIFFSAKYLVSETLFAPMDNFQFSYTVFQSFNNFSEFLTGIGTAFGKIMANFFQPKNLINLKFYLFLYILICVGSNMNLSGADLEGAVEGLSVIIVLIFTLVIVEHFAILFLRNIAEVDAKQTTWLISLTRYNSVVYSVMLLAIFFNAVIALPLYILRKARGY